MFMHLNIKIALRRTDYKNKFSALQGETPYGTAA